MIKTVEAVERLLTSLGIASGIATLLIMLCVVADVSGRFLFNNPIHGATEMSELLLVAMVFFGLAAAQQGRQNYAIDVASRHLSPRLQSALDLIGYVFCLGLVVLLAWFSSNQAINAFERGESGFGIIPFPIWPARIVLAIGLWLLAAQFLCDIIRHLAGQPRSRSAEGAHAGSHE